MYISVCIWPVYIIAMIGVFLIAVLNVRPLRFDNILSESKVRLSARFEDVECGKNSFVNETGGCQCSSQFPFGDPYSGTGCWGCNPPCDQNAECYASDQCRCLPGFIGDGLDICEKPIPKILKITPTKGSVSGGDFVKLFIESPPDYTVTQAFCRFGPVSVQAQFANTSDVHCLVPPNRPGNAKIGVSFDGSKWSRGSHQFTYERETKSSYMCIAGCIFGALVILIFAILWWYFDRNTDIDEESLPLNKWHMHQGQIALVEEKSFVDFLVNITIN